MYKINLKTFSNLSCMLSYANDVNKCDNCKEGDCTKDYLGECVFDYQVSAYKFLVLEEEDDVPTIYSSILDEDVSPF